MKIPYKYAAALSVSLGLFMAVLDNTIVNVALTPMKNAFNTDLNSVQWVITGYFLSQAAVIPTAGYLSNVLGIKKVFLFCLGVFTLGSLMCGLSDLPIFQDSAGHAQIVWLIVFRVLQGIGGGALFPLATAIAFGVFPPAERAAGSAVVAIPVLLAPAFGPTIGGLLVDGFSWNAIFFVNVPIGIIAFILIARILKPDPKREPNAPKSSFDVPGLALSMLGVIAIVYAFTVVSQTDSSTVNATHPQGSIYGWGYWLVWTLLGIGAALLVAFAVWELKFSKDPVLDLRLFRSYNFAVANFITWIIRGVVFGSFFLLPVFFENIKYPPMSAVDAGLAFMPQGITAAIAIALGGRLYNVIGPRWLVVLGMIALTASTFWLINLNDASDGWSLMPALILRGLGFGWGSFPVQTLALQAITGKALPKASSLFNVTAQIFSSVGIAVLTTIFVTQSASNVPNQAQIQSFAAQAAADQPAAHAYVQSYLSQHSGVTIASAINNADFQKGVEGAVLASSPTVKSYTQQFISQHPGTNPLQAQSNPAFFQGLLTTTAPTNDPFYGFQQDITGRIGAFAGIPALNSVFTVVLWGTAAMILVSLLLPGVRKLRASEAGAEEHRGMAMVEG